MDNIIDRILKERPSETYEPQYEPSFSPDLIITVKSQPILLPPSEMDFKDIVIRLADFGHGAFFAFSPRNRMGKPGG